MNIDLERNYNILCEITRIYRETGAPPKLEEWWEPEAKDLHAELSDLRMLTSHLTEIYSHVTEGQISKPTTDVKAVMQLCDELEQERTDRELGEALADIHEALSAAAVPKEIRIMPEDQLYSFTILERIEILAVRCSLVYGIKHAQDLAHRLSRALYPTPAHMRADEDKRAAAVLVMQPIIDRAWDEIIKAARAERGA